MRSKTLAVLVPAMTITCLVGFAEPAAAAPSESRVVITSATSDTEHVHVRGKVASNDKACKKNRKISIYHDTDPAGPDPNDYLIATVRSNKKGHWDMASVALPDKVYAVMAKKRGCTGDESPTEDVVVTN